MDPELEGGVRVCELREVYPLEVDYSADLEEAMRAGGYNDIHREILPSASWFTDFGRKEKLQMKLLEFEQPVSTEEVLAKAKAKSLRLANLFELLAFGAKYPEVQWDYPVLALGSRWRNQNGDQGIAYLWHNAFGRALEMGLIQNGKQWDNLCRFAAVHID